MRPYMIELVLPDRIEFPPLGDLREQGIALLDVAELERLGPPCWEGEPLEMFERRSPGPAGPTRVWWFRGHCGLEFVLEHDVQGQRLVVAADESAEFEHMLAHLPLDVRATQHPPSQDEVQRRDGKGGWVVYRQDDIGNRFDVANFSRESSARCHARLMEDRRHKQSFYVEPRGELPPPPPGEVGPFDWALVRSDDHGNRFVLKRGPEASRLESLATLFNRQPRHKQTCFVEPSSSPQASTHE